MAIDGFHQVVQVNRAIETTELLEWCSSTRCRLDGKKKPPVHRCPDVILGSVTLFVLSIPLPMKLSRNRNCRLRTLLTLVPHNVTVQLYLPCLTVTAALPFVA